MRDEAHAGRVHAARASTMPFEDPEAHDRAPVRDRNPRPSALIVGAALAGALFGLVTGGDQQLMSAVVFGVLTPMGAWVLRLIAILFGELLDGSA